MLYFTKILVLGSVFCVVSIAAPYQELLPKPGYVPVYIREGNTPLSQINPKLAEAFHEDEVVNQISNEPAIRKIAEVPNSAEMNQQAEVNKSEVLTNMQVQHIKSKEENGKETGKEEKESAVSDIAEFTSDDIKILNGE